MWLITLKLEENDIMVMLIGYSHHKNKHSTKTFTSEVHLQALKLVPAGEWTMRGCQSLSSPHVIPHTSLHTLTSLSQPWKHSHTPLKYLLSATVKECDMEPAGVHTHTHTHTLTQGPQWMPMTGRRKISYQTLSLFKKYSSCSHDNKLLLFFSSIIHSGLKNNGVFLVSMV